MSSESTKPGIKNVREIKKSSINKKVLDDIEKVFPSEYLFVGFLFRER